MVRSPFTSRATPDQVCSRAKHAFEGQVLCALGGKAIGRDIRWMLVPFRGAELVPGWLPKARQLECVDQKLEPHNTTYRNTRTSTDSVNSRISDKYVSVRHALLRVSRN